ncbi:UDP-glycosyltransferase 89B2-like [Alnus glutinosa]|uniref:UDP-glycosyltransferase 89B2-like n=1 Tax=Alnus glutinosa TaxID=3517 RepID=UPI002D774E69|nr:UDP-glycosyltransferase 89B2-like [Alnus glutinosa]
MSTPALHVLAYPYPTAGHIIPLLDLTRELLTRGLTVTVLVTPNNLPLLDPYISSHPSSLNHLVLPAPDITPPPQKRHIANMRALRDLHYPILLQWFQSHSSPPVAIISDFFLGWTHHLACELGVPRLVFSPSGAFGLSVGFSISRDPPKNDDPENINFLVSLPRIPNSPVYPWWQVPQHFRIGQEGDPDWDFYRNNMLANIASWGLVLNSFAELEGVYIEHLKRELGKDRVWAVGPVLPPVDGDSEEPVNRGGASSVPCHEVMTWLDSRPTDSVVYVCFGSRVVLNSQQMDVLAAALEVSGVQFILCLRVPDGGQAQDDHGVIPDGFEGRVRGRGFVIKGWAPQVTILRHRAVGAFLTHCGWNSVLEGIAAGVVMLTWPMGADQFTNSKLLVDQLGVGISVGEGTQNIPESSELARLLGISVVGDRPERVRAKELSDAALVAGKGGSSHQDLNEMAKRLANYKK